MKKILAIALALCLSLSLAVAAFAADGSVTLPKIPHGSPAGASSGSTASGSKYTYSATAANGAPVNATVSVATSGAMYDEATAYGTVVAVYAISVPTNVTGPVTLNVYAPGAEAGDTVLVRDDWEVLEGADLKVSGDRALFTADAAAINQWHYFAIVKNYTEVNVNVPTEAPETEEDEPEGGDDMNVADEPAEEPKADENPKTGIVLAVVPMMAAAAAIVVSKKR